MRFSRSSRDHSSVKSPHHEKHAGSGLSLIAVPAVAPSFWETRSKNSKGKLRISLTSDDRLILAPVMTRIFDTQTLILSTAGFEGNVYLGGTR
jgi:hypothetical protein